MPPQSTYTLCPATTNLWTFINWQLKKEKKKKKKGGGYERKEKKKGQLGREKSSYLLLLLSPENLQFKLE